MNAFFIPQLGSMIYTMNGMTTQLARCSRSSQRMGSSEKLDVFNPYGSRPSTAALTMAGARKARLSVMRTARSLQRS